MKAAFPWPRRAAIRPARRKCALGLFPSRQFRVALAHRRDRHYARERMRERIDPVGAQPLELGAAVVLRFRGQRSILVIFSLRCGPRGTGTETMSLRFLPISALPTGDSFESFISLGFASAEPTILYFDRLVGLLVLDVHGRADRHDVGRDVALVDDGRRAQLVLEVGDLLLEHRLLVLRVVVLGVLGDVAEGARLLDPLRDFLAPVGREVLDLRLQVLETLRCEQTSFGMSNPFRSRILRTRECSNRLRPLRRTVQAAQ